MEYTFSLTSIHGSEVIRPSPFSEPFYERKRGLLKKGLENRHMTRTCSLERTEIVWIAIKRRWLTEVN